ncbi:unnamed protein product [Arabis nemorensis]|uniref:TF-B3 domain-containing protein n=1 Tax=Arabis nemorensis TaxID=586526 RepID=A0A565AND4_9BRAS|nr:unnamed protein product [Arabis nemorensis]
MRFLNTSLYDQRKKKIQKKTPEQREAEFMWRVFDLVPRRKRSLRVHQKHPDYSKVPRRTRTPSTYTKTPPKWIIRVMKDMKILDDDDPKLIIEKALDLNDFDPLQNRLSIPFESLITKDFLNCDESRIIGDEGINNDGKIGVGAILVDQRTEQWNVVLKKCVVNNDSAGTSLESYVLGGEWSNIVKANGLRDDDNIGLWCFRGSGILFLALDFAGDAVDLLE